MLGQQGPYYSPAKVYAIFMALLEHTVYTLYIFQYQLQHSVTIDQILQLKLRWLLFSLH